MRGNGTLPNNYYAINTYHNLIFSKKPTLNKYFFFHQKRCFVSLQLLCFRVKGRVDSGQVASLLHGSCKSKGDFLKQKKTRSIYATFLDCAFFESSHKNELYFLVMSKLWTRKYTHISQVLSERVCSCFSSFKLQEKYIYSSEQYLSACGAFISLSSSLKISASAYERWWHMHMCDLHICIFVHFMFYVDHWLQGKMLNPHY